MTTTTIHYDSLYSKAGVFNNTMHSLSNIDSVRLETMELPVSFLNVRAGMNTMSFIYNATTYSLTVQANQYNDIATLLIEVNAKIVLALNNAASNLTFATNPVVPGKLIASSTVTTAVFSFPTASVLTNTILGVSATDACVNATIVCANNYNLNSDLYLNMVIAQLPTKYINNSMVKCSFKIPVINTYNQVMYYGSYLSQTYVCATPMPNLKSFSVEFYDRYGNLVTLAADYSFSLCYTITMPTTYF